jgi:hypothetical protein
VSVHHSCPKRRTDTGFPGELTPDFRGGQIRQIAIAAKFNTPDPYPVARFQVGEDDENTAGIHLNCPPGAATRLVQEYPLGSLNSVHPPTARLLGYFMIVKKASELAMTARAQAVDQVPGRLPGLRQRAAEPGAEDGGGLLVEK